MDGHQPFKPLHTAALLEDLAHAGHLLLGEAEGGDAGGGAGGGRAAQQAPALRHRHTPYPGEAGETGKTLTHAGKS